MKKIIAISGSLRKNSFNTSLLQHLKKITPDGFEVHIAPIHEVPLYNNDLEKDHFPQVVADLKNEIENAAGLLISSPEYNNSFSGVLKNTIDWLSRPTKDIARVFHQKPVGIIGATTGGYGTLLSQTAWLPTFRYFNVKLFTTNSLYISKSSETFDEKGNLIDEKMLKKAEEYIQGFCSFLK